MDLRTGVAVDYSDQSHKTPPPVTTPPEVSGAPSSPAQLLMRTGTKVLCPDCGRLTGVAGMPRWENDPTVRLFGWDDERCPECGARIPGDVTSDWHDRRAGRLQTQGGSVTARVHCCLTCDVEWIGTESCWICGAAGHPGLTRHYQDPPSITPRRPHPGVHGAGRR